MKEKLEIQTETIIKLNTDSVKNDIMSKLYASGYQQDDREELIKQVDQFLNQDESQHQTKDMLKSKEKLKNANFSGVTHSLDELYSLMQTFQDQAKYFGRSEEQNINAQAFRFFQGDLKSKMKNAQLETAKMVAKRFQKTVQVCNAEVQCNLEEYKKVILIQIEDMSKKITDNELVIRVQDSQITQLHEANNKAYQEKVQILTQLREAREINVKLQNTVMQKSNENEMIGFENYQNEKKVKNMYHEIEQLQKEKDRMNNRINLLESQILLLKEKDRDNRLELKDMKMDYNQKIRELRKAEKRLFQVGKLDDHYKEVEEQKAIVMSNEEIQEFKIKELQQQNEELARKQQLIYQQNQATTKVQKQLYDEQQNLSNNLKSNVMGLINLKHEKDAKEFFNNQLKNAIHKKMLQSKLQAKQAEEKAYQVQDNQENTTAIKNNKSGEELNNQSSKNQIKDKKNSEIMNQKQNNQGEKKQSFKQNRQAKSRDNKSSKRSSIAGNKQENKYQIPEKFVEQSRSMSAESGISSSNVRNVITKSVYQQNQETTSGFGNKRNSIETLANQSSMNYLKVNDTKRNIIKVSNITVTKNDQSTETDMYELFQYFIDFLKKVEILIQTSKLQELLENYGYLVKSDMSTFKKEAQESTDRLNKLHKYLGKISSLSNKGGDVFFRGIFQIFQAQPHIFKQEQLERYKMEHEQRKTESSKSILDTDFKVKVQYSVGGGYNKRMK